ncbi:MAG: hypothetical protein ABW321_05630 [Polyangiales bacterium]
MFKPGSVLWLLRHELRLVYRGARRKLLGSIGTVLLLLVLHTAAVPLAIGLRGLSLLSPRVPLLLVSGVVGMACLTLCARSLTLAVQSLYERGDTDLLLSSPLPPATWFSVRASAIALLAAAELALLLLPIANVFVFFGFTRWLMAYVLVPFAALLGTTGSLWLAIGMLRSLGPRRMRLIAQLVAAFIGMAAALVTQLPNLVWQRSDDFLASDWLLERLPPEQSLLWLPAKIAMGSFWTPLAALGSIGLFFWSVRRLSGPFIAGLALTAGSAARPRARRVDLPRFRSGVRAALIRKELRVALRDPWLMTQLLQQNVFLLPATLMFTRFDLYGLSFAWLAIVMCAGTSAGALAWVASAGEEAPELLGTAPIGALDRLLAQVVASLVPVVLGVTVLCSLLMLRHPFAALIIGLCSLGNALCNVLFNVRFKRPMKRIDPQRRKPVSLPGLIAELAFMSIWIGITLLSLALHGGS